MNTWQWTLVKVSWGEVKTFDLVWGECCNSAVGRTAYNPSADLKPIWAELCSSEPAAANSAQHDNGVSVLVSAGAGGSGGDSFSWCLILGACKYQVRPTYSEGRAWKQQAVWLMALGCLFVVAKPQRRGLKYFSVRGIKQNLMHRSAPFRKVDAALWLSLCLMLSCCVIS